MTKNIHITKEGGVVLNRDYIHETLDNALKTVANGQYTLSIKRKVKKRTLDQSRWFWLCMTCLERSSETGSSKEDFHDFYCTKFLRRRISVNGTDTIVIGGTSKLNTVAFNEFMEKIYLDVAENYGIHLPHPDDLQWEAFQNEYEQYI